MRKFLKLLIKESKDIILHGFKVLEKFLIKPSNKFLEDLVEIPLEWFVEQLIFKISWQKPPKIKKENLKEQENPLEVFLEEFLQKLLLLKNKSWSNLRRNSCESLWRNSWRIIVSISEKYHAKYQKNLKRISGEMTGNSS